MESVRSQAPLRPNTEFPRSLLESHCYQPATIAKIGRESNCDFSMRNATASRKCGSQSSLELQSPELDFAACKSNHAQ